MAITVADFNNVRTKLVNVFGSGGTGYGQQLNVANLPATSSSLITSSRWNGLGSDLKKARQHQTGDPVPNTELPTLSSTTPITNTIYQQFVTLANTVETNKFVIATAGQAPQRTQELIQTATLNGNWTTALYHRVVFTFPGYTRAATSQLQAATVSAENHCRAFFNAGGEIRFRASRTGTAANTKDTDWTNLLAAMGTIRFNYAATSTSPDFTATSPGTFPAGSTGFYVSPSFTTINLPTANTVMFFKTGSAYGTNRYQISMRANSATNPTQLTFIIAFLDNAVGNPNTDEPVTGTTTSTIEVIRPSGQSVSVDIPDRDLTANPGDTLVTTVLT